MKTKSLLCLLNVLLWGTLCTAQIMDLEGHRQELAKQQAALEAEQDKKLTTIQAGYRQALEGLLAEVMSEGDLEKVEIVKAEQSRVAARLTPPQSYAVLESLNRLQTKLKYLLLDESHEYGRAVVEMYEAYDESLRQQEISLVQANRIDDALKLRSIRDTLKTDPALVEIRNRLPKKPVDKENRPELTSTWVYLSDLQETQSKIGYGQLGRGNQLGYGRNQKLRVGKREIQKGISTHPPPNGKAFVVWEFTEHVVAFEGEVGINHTGINRIVTPVRFRLFGDGKVIWTSEPLGKGSTPQAVNVSLANVKRLRLEVECPGSHNSAHAIWIDPKVR